MGDVNFYLKKPELSTQKGKTTGKKESAKKSLIYLQFKYNGQKLVYSFGQSIDPKLWNPGKQRVKSNNQTTEDGKYSLNELLGSLEKLCLKTYNDELKNGIPSKETIKRALFNFVNQNDEGEKKTRLYDLIERFISGEIKYKGADKSYHTTKTYNTVLNHLKAFELKKRYKIDFDTITLEFFYKYLGYLKELPRKNKSGNVTQIGLAQNTIAKHIQVIKTFMNEAVDQELTTNSQFRNKKFTVSWEESDAVYLNEKEIIKLHNHDFTRNKKLEQVRDLFVFGCFVGLRFSDFSAIRPENIVEMEGELFIKMVTGKTGELVVIPCNPIVLKIFEKYSSSPNKLPKSISNQKFNDYIKEVCREAGFTEKGRLIETPGKELWECVSSHSCRRSFSTNLYLDSFPPIDIMKVTGHKTEKSFLKYIRVSKLDTARRLSQHMKLKWSEKILRVAS